MQRAVLSRPFLSIPVPPSVNASVKRVDCDKTKDTCAYILITHGKIIHPSFFAIRMVAGGDLLYLKCWARLILLYRKRRFLIDSPAVPQP